MLLPFLAFYASALACIPVQGERILAADLAKAQPVFAAIPADTPLGLTPNPGIERLLQPSDLARLAARYQIAAPPEDWREPACFVFDTHPVDPAELERALQTQLALDGASIELVDYSRWPIPAGNIEFPSATRTLRPDRSDGTILFRGLVRYTDRRSMSIWVRAKLTVERQAVVAAEDIPPGKPIEPQQVRLQRFTHLSLLPEPIDDPAAVVGLTPRRRIAAGSEIDPRLLAAPRLVEAGDTVRVDVHRGDARVSLAARAESGGRAGEKIFVRNQASGKRFPAVIDGPGHAVVEADGEN